jgi:hypothetical protein
MTIGTGGSNAATSLTAIKHPGSYMQLSGVALSIVETDADMATIENAIKDDQNINLPAPGQGNWGYSRNGMLYVPNRGVLKCLPGDCIMVDVTTGWPILVSARALAAGPWTTTAT